MTFYPSETVIEELARRVREAAQKVAARKKHTGDPEENSWPLEYRLKKKEYSLFLLLTAAYTHAEEKHRPAAERYDELKHALRVWEAAGGDQLSLL